MPCDVLFVGEAPGESEDTLGYPFIGPAGSEFDEIMESVFSQTSRFKFGICNILGCWPHSETDTGHGETRAPNKKEAMACRPRLLELIKLCKPRLILTLGNIARQQLPRPLQGIRENALLHPAAILYRDSRASADTDRKRMIQSIVTHTNFLRS